MVACERVSTHNGWDLVDELQAGEAVTRSLPDERSSRYQVRLDRAKRARNIAFVLAGSTVLLKVVACLPVSQFGHPGFFNGVLGPAAKLSTALATALAAATAPRGRLIWSAFALGTACWGAGDLYAQIAQSQAATPAQVPAFSFTDGALLTAYALWYLSLVGLARRSSAGLRSQDWLDGAIAATAVFAVSFAAVLPTVLHSLDGVQPVQAALAVAYPIADIVVLVMTVVAVIGQRSVRDPALNVLVLGLIMLAVTDLSYAAAVAHDTYRDGDLHDAGWVLGLLLIALGPLFERPGTAVSPQPRSSSATVVAVPILGTLVALAVIVAGDVWSMPIVATLVASAAIVLSCVRMAWSLKESMALAVARRDARTDMLTGLANRRALDETVSTHLGDGRACALVLLDLDGFKDVNDSLGHLAGDELLVGLTTRLVAALGDRTLVARVGGDEFAALVHGNDPDEAARAGAAVAHDLSAVFGTTFDIHDRNLTMTASVGVATARPGATFTELFRRADIAMYEAKRTGEKVVLFDDMPERPDRLATIAGIRAAMRSPSDGHLELHYQPLTRLQPPRNRATTVAPQMVEALVRWHHPERGMVFPGEFIPAVESSDLILELTDWVLHRALHDQVRWNAMGLDVRVAVNFSARVLLHAEATTMVASALRDLNVKPSRLKLEITESAIMDDPRRAQNAVAELRALGVFISIDDFGTGYTSLRLLRELAADEIKLDRTFVANAALNGPDAAIANAVAQLAQRLGVSTVAEGVENVETRSLFRAFGYDYMQGYLDSRPVPVDQIQSWLLEHRPDDDATPSLRHDPPIHEFRSFQGLEIHLGSVTDEHGYLAEDAPA